jgi:predicted transcriptional regulator of viral defense system
MMAGGDLLRSRDFDLEGVPRVVLKRMVASGELDQPQRGVYRISSLAMEADETKTKAAELASRHPYGVLCLMSALRWHGLTDDMNSEWTVAVKRTSPVAASPWVRIVRWMAPPFHEVGIEVEKVAGVDVRITSAARTVADVLRRVNGYSDEIATKAFVSFLQNGGEPEQVAKIARQLGFVREIERIRTMPLARELLSQGAFQQIDASDFSF